MTTAADAAGTGLTLSSLWERFRNLSPGQKVATALSAAVPAFWLYDLLILPKLDGWGATPEEQVRPLPGDALVPGDEFWRMTVATTIEAPPEKIYPYFVQMGQDRAGFYSFDLLERALGFGITNTYRIRPEWQDRKPGDFITFHKSGMGMRLARMDPPRSLTLVTNGAEPSQSLPPGKWEMLLPLLFDRSQGEFVAWNWDFNLLPQANGSTRLIVRCIAAGKGSAFATFFGKHAFALPSDIMDIEMLRRVKALAEGRYPVPGGPT